MNKMTAKKFFEVLKHVGIDVKRFGYEYILVFIERVFWDEEKEYSEKYPCTAKEKAEKAKYIHNILKEYGYYKD